MIKQKITVSGSHVHEVGYRLFILNYAKIQGFSRIYAFNTIDNNEGLVIILVEEEEYKINDLVVFLRTNKPDFAIISLINQESYSGEVMTISAFMQDLQLEQICKAVPAILEMRDMQKEALRKHEEQIGLHHKQLDLHHKQLELHHEEIGLHHEELQILEDIQVDMKGMRQDLNVTLKERLEKLEDTIKIMHSAMQQAGLLA